MKQVLRWEVYDRQIDRSADLTMYLVVYLDTFNYLIPAKPKPKSRHKGFVYTNII